LAVDLKPDDPVADVPRSSELTAKHVRPAGAQKVETGSLLIAGDFLDFG